MSIVRGLKAAIAVATLFAAASAGARARPPEIIISDTSDGVRIAYALAAPTSTFAVRAASEEGPPQGTHVRVLEPGLSYRQGRIEGVAPFRSFTLAIVPDRGEVDSRYPLLAAVAGRGHVLYAPYVLPDGPVRARVDIGGGRYRSLSREEAAGGYVLVGAAPARHGAIRGLASANTPPALESRFYARAGELVAFYAARLHRRLPRPPTLIVSVVDEPADALHRFFRGDVTPNGVVLLRFHGTPDQIADPNSTRQFSTFLAHELFHLWNRRLGDHPMIEAWLHEGSADYFGWLAAASLWPDEAAVEANVERALTYCSLFTGSRALARLDQAEAMTNRYTCGAVVNWLADLGVRQASGGRLDGFDLWARLLAGDDYGPARFREAAGALAPGATASIDAMIDGGGPARWRAIADFAAGTGAIVEARPPRQHLVQFPAARAIVLSACGAFWGAGDTDVEFYVSAPSDCAAMSGNVTLLRVEGVDPMQGQLFFDRIREGCAARRSLAMTIRTEGAAPRETSVRCTVDVEDPVPEFHVARALPVSPPARSAP